MLSLTDVIDLESGTDGALTVLEAGDISLTGDMELTASVQLSTDELWITASCPSMSPCEMYFGATSLPGSAPAGTFLMDNASGSID